MRSQLLIQKALELAAEVRSLGSALLSALEKDDNEGLALLRQANEIALQQLTQDVRFLQWKQAQEAIQSLLRGRATTLERYRYYMRLLDQTPDGTLAPDTFSVTDFTETQDGQPNILTEAGFDDAYQSLVGQYDLTLAPQAYSQLRLAGTSSPSNQSGNTGAGQLYLNVNEDAELNTHLPTARDTRLAANVANAVAVGAVFIPAFYADLHYWGLGAHAKVFSGEQLSEAARCAADILNTIAAYEQDQAGMAGRTAGYQRRADEWTLQCNLAARELMQVGRQLIGAIIAEQLAHGEYLNVRTQITQSQAVLAYMQTKFTNQQLYDWMKGQLTQLYYSYYSFALDTANKAEATMKRELMRPEVDAVDYIQTTYWNAGWQGLLAGEALYLDVKRMELAYHDNNKREFEITRHISLRQLAPMALLSLRTTGTCTLDVPEWFFDRECPGHYMRRVKTVALSLPSVVGPYTTVPCTLSLQRSTVRTSPELLNGAYARQGDGDGRFTDYFGSLDAIVTSAGSNDSGMFETNLRDERFLPFEGAGAVSTWTLQLPQDFPPFDYMTLSDVIVHMRYTARQAGDPLGSTAIAEMKAAFATDSPADLALLFLLRNDFPTQWAAFVNAPAGTPFQMPLSTDDFPYAVQSMTLTVTNITAYGYGASGLSSVTLAIDPSADLKRQGYSDLALPVDGNVIVNTADQVFLVIQYQAG